MRYRMMLVPLALAVLSGGQRVYAGDSCQPISDAMAKMMTTPNHSYSTHTAAYLKGETRTNEAIYTGGKIYLRIHDKWMLSRMTPQEISAQKEDNLEHTKAACHLLRNEYVGTEAAAVYALHSENDDFKEDGQIWISKGTGLPLRNEQDIDMGEAAGKEHRSTRYEYGNIRPPI